MRIIELIYKPQRDRLTKIAKDRKQRHRESNKKINMARFNRQGKKGRVL